MKTLSWMASALMILGSGIASAHNQGGSESADQTRSPSMEPTPEMRREMAQMHQEMADCLRSNQALSECWSEMEEQCRTMMGGQDCPMMGQMMGPMHGPMRGKGRHHGMGQGPMMNQGEARQEAPERGVAEEGTQGEESRVKKESD